MPRGDPAQRMEALEIYVAFVGITGEFLVKETAFGREILEIRAGVVL